MTVWIGYMNDYKAIFKVFSLWIFLGRERAGGGGGECINSENVLIRENIKFMKKNNFFIPNVIRNFFLLFDF